MQISKTTNALAVSILLVMGFISYGAAWNDVIIVDEDPHIASGITYADKQDMRLNPEHPPLVKWLAGIPPLVFQDLHIPYDDPTWTEEVNGQWEFGQKLIFQSGNDADAITRLSRLAPLFLALLLGFYIYRWAAELAGAGTGLFALLLYATSPAILAHGVLVTTDVPAALGVFVGTYYFIKFLKQPTRKTLILAGVAFGLAQLLKFSVALLIPYFGILAFAFWWLQRMAGPKPDKRAPSTSGAPKRPFLTYVGGTVLIGIIGLALIYLMYAAVAIPGYPAERQLSDTQALVGEFPPSGEAYGNVMIAMAEVPVLRPLAQYFLGLGMVLQRTAGGNTAFFLGTVDNQSWLSYFPVVYLTKVRLAVHIMTLMVLVLGVGALLKKMFPLGARRVAEAKGFLRRTAEVKRQYFTELAMFLFIAIYWASSLTGNLNIGVRHLSPTLPFLFVLIAIGLKVFVKMKSRESGGFSFKALSESTQRIALVGILLLWAIIAGLAPFPHYLSSYNELASFYGGGENIVTDSNLDWGQDLKRLSWYVEEQGIEKLYFDYFGWADPAYYMPDVDIEGWWANGEAPPGWLAVSLSFRQQACAEPTRGFAERTGFNATGYCYLQDIEPEAIIGESIAVYNFTPDN